MAETELGQYLVGLAVAFGLGQLAAEATVDRLRFEDGEDVLLDVELAEDGGFLGQVAHAEAGALVHGQLGDVLAVEGDLASIGRDLAGGHAEAGGLAGAV